MIKNVPQPKEFNWLTRLNQLVNGKVRMPRDYGNLCRLAEKWPTCACGQLCKLLPRYSNNGLFHLIGQPLDLRLEELGIEFSGQIEERKWKSARAIFRKIERRSAQLLAQLLKTQPATV